jgi:hypothetical protein
MLMTKRAINHAGVSDLHSSTRVSFRPSPRTLTSAETHKNGFDSRDSCQD